MDHLWTHYGPTMDTLWTLTTASWHRVYESTLHDTVAEYKTPDDPNDLMALMTPTALMILITMSRRRAYLRTT